MKILILIGFILGLSACSSIQEWDQAYKEKQRAETAVLLKTLDRRYLIGRQIMGSTQPLINFEIRPIPDSLDHIKFTAYKPDGSPLFDKAEAICESYAKEGALRCELAGTEYAIGLTELKYMNYTPNAILEQYKYLFKIMIFRKGMMLDQHIYYANFAN